MTGMNDTGIVRRVDELGRIVIPMELRRTLGIRVRDPLSIYVDGDHIILARHHDACALCGDTEASMLEVNGRMVCTDCVDHLKARR
jgi:transcriptional pleiotropic regulator of transition state genes